MSPVVLPLVSSEPLILLVAGTAVALTRTPVPVLAPAGVGLAVWIGIELVARRRDAPPTAAAMLAGPLGALCVATWIATASLAPCGPKVCLAPLPLGAGLAPVLVASALAATALGVTIRRQQRLGLPVLVGLGVTGASLIALGARVAHVVVVEASRGHL